MSKFIPTPEEAKLWFPRLAGNRVLEGEPIEKWATAQRELEYKDELVKQRYASVIGCTITEVKSHGAEEFLVYLQNRRGKRYIWAFHADGDDMTSLTETLEEMPCRAG